MSSEAAPAAAGRLWEIDLLRTAAIVMMVAYHAAWDVDMLAVDELVDPFSGGWRALQVACGSLFLAVMGMTLAVMNARGRARGLSGWPLYRRHARRAATVLGAALLVSAATFVALGGDDYVRFGILHCIGVAMLLCPLLIRLGVWLLPLAAAIAWAGLALAGTDPRDAPWLLPFGVPQAGGAGVDWYPLLPWLAPALVGLWLGAVLYPRGDRGRWGARLSAAPRWAPRATAPGRHALPIYLVHQPVLIPLVALALLAAGVEIDTSGNR
ncbi:MAG: heparan-alpha-glucosaminide N-acetyltransferase [Thermoleophilia bacterium]